MTNEQWSPELERLRAAHQQIPDPDPEVLSAVRERLQGAAEREPAARPVRTRSRRGRPLRRLALEGLSQRGLWRLDLESVGGVVDDRRSWRCRPGSRSVTICGPRSSR